MVIELDQGLARELTVALEEAGYTVVRADDTRDGLRQLYQAYPDLIILKREHPMVNGEDPYMRVRRN
jgi:DNA-binding response OmpR family regulator